MRIPRTDLTGEPVNRRRTRSALALCAALAGGALALPGGTALAQTACDAPVGSTTKDGYTVADPDCDRNGTAFTALPGATTFTGIEQGQAYRIEVPSAWNGDLVVWAHGYRGEGKEVYVDSPVLRQHFISQGYAWAASSYQTNSYDVQQGVNDSHAMVQRFLDKTGTPAGALDRVIIHGASMGGHVAGVTLEQHASTWDAGYPICGVLGDTELFDYFLGANVTAAALTGVQLKYPMASSEFATAAQTMTDRLFTTRPTEPTDAGRAWAGAVQQLSGGTRPGFASSFGFWNGFGFGDYPRVPFLLGQYPGVNRVLTSTGVPGNAGDQYQLDGDPAVSPAEKQLDDTVLRVTATPTQQVVPVIASTPQVPVLSLHGLGDLFVPFSMEQVYAREAAANGKPFVSRAIRATGHCDFTAAELAKGFDDLVRWVDTGFVPSGDRVTDAAAVAAPTFGCRFTNGAHANFTAEAPCPTFTDIVGSVHAPAIRSLAADQVLLGTGDRFSPRASISRGQVASVVARALGLQAGAGDPSFSDTAGNVHADAVRAVAGAGLVAGFPDGTFRPNAPVSRAQLAAVVARALGVDDRRATGCFSDVAGTTHERSICALAELDVVNGATATTFAPNGSISRDQAASLVWRASL